MAVADAADAMVAGAAGVGEGEEGPPAVDVPPPAAPAPQQQHDDPHDNEEEEEEPVCRVCHMYVCTH